MAICVKDLNNEPRAREPVNMSQVGIFDTSNPGDLVPDCDLTN